MYVHTIVVLPHNLSELTSVGHIIASVYFYAIVFFTTKNKLLFHKGGKSSKDLSIIGWIILVHIAEFMKCDYFVRQITSGQQYKNLIK